MRAEFWRMGANPVPCTQAGRLARRFEELGWDGLAVPEAHGLMPDPYAVLGAAAQATTALKLGTAVAIPLRHPLLAANAMATVQGMSQGRARFGLGRGDSGVKVLHQSPMRVADFEAYVTQVQGFLRRDDVELNGNVSSMARLAEIDPSLDVRKPPLDIAVTGPRTLEVAAKTADGINFSVGADVGRLRNSIGQARTACDTAGRAFDELELGCFVQVAVIDEHDTSGREAIRGVTLTHARFSGFEPRPTSEDVSEAEHREYRHALETMEAVYRSPRGGMVRKPGAAPGELEFYPRDAASDELIDAFAIVGSGEYCAERLQEIAELGFQRILIGTHTAGVDLEEMNTERIAREVLPLARR
jgi:5,10-methylenetetrahydromethanopterin reductase